VESEGQVLSVMFHPTGDAVIDQLANDPPSEIAAKLGRRPQPIQSGSDHLILDRFLTTKLVIFIKSKMSARSRKSKLRVSLRKGESHSLGDLRSPLSCILRSL
jgi:hypothetical protein